MPEVKASPATPDKSLSHSRCNLVSGTEKNRFADWSAGTIQASPRRRSVCGVRSGKLGGTLSSGASSLEGTAKQFYGTGRRRESIARVYIKQGAARFTVNGRPVDEYFRNVAWNTAAVEPLKFTQMLDQVEVKCIVKGGGVGGQSGAVRMGLSRALSRLNPELRPALRKNGFLTRDPRMKERKKYGQKGARRRFQFSKR
jgi:small subunit ribosomal protein S9